MLNRTAQKFIRTRPQFNLPIRAFAVQVKNWPPACPPNGLSDVVEHPDGKEHHHDHVHAAAQDHKFIEAGTNKKTLVFDNLRGSAPAVQALDNQFHHMNNLPMFHHEYIFSGGYAHANLIVNEANTHDEPYGYELGDDPFDTHGHGDQPFLYLFAGSIAFITMATFHFRFDRRKTSEVLYHQRLTALQIEDELVAMRR